MSTKASHLSSFLFYVSHFCKSISINLLLLPSLLFPPRGRQSSEALFVIEGREGIELAQKFVWVSPYNATEKNRNELFGQPNTNRDTPGPSLAQPVFGLDRPISWTCWDLNTTHTHTHTHTHKPGKKVNITSKGTLQNHGSPDNIQGKGCSITFP